MHANAQKWDQENGFDSSFATGQSWPKDRPLPEGRPCDWCGKSVDKGFIHPECQKKERDLYLDILY